MYLYTFKKDGYNCLASLILRREVDDFHILLGDTEYSGLCVWHKCIECGRNIWVGKNINENVKWILDKWWVDVKFKKVAFGDFHGF